MVKIGCCVPGCVPEKSSSRHRFIHPEKNAALFLMWLNVISNARLLELDKIYVYNNYRVCEAHFRVEDFGPNKVLKRTAYPTLLLPASHQTTSIAMTEKDQPCASEEAQCHDNGNMLSCTTSSVLQRGNAATSFSVMERDQSCAIEEVQQHDHGDISSDPTTALLQTASNPTSPVIQWDHTYYTIKEAKATLHDDGNDILSRPRTPVHQRGNQGILHNLNISAASELTPKAKFSYKEFLSCKKKIMKLNRSKLNFKRRLQEASNVSENAAFQKITQSMSRTQQNFFRSQIFCASKKPQAHRFTTEDKVMALALYKQSGVGYKLLRRLFALPSRATIMKMLNAIPIAAGMNHTIFSALKEVTASLPALDKHCVLIFDEMSLTPSLRYNQFADEVDGFEDFGDHRTDHIANHVQVFMLRGINRKWKQPILYQYVKGAVKTAQLMKTIREIIIATKEAGLNVVATICDQGTNNTSAINQLVQQTRANYLRRNEELHDFVFEVDGSRVIPLYDPPHLLKGLRNNLLQKNILFEANGQKKIAKWRDIYKAWQLDGFSGELRAMPKITEYHVDSQKMRKMKVSAAAQVFSHAVSSTINLMARSSYTTGDGTQMERRATETAEFCKFVDSLFDSVNGYGRFNKQGKILKTHVNVESNVHSEFWRNSINILESMKCIEADGRLTTPPTFKNWKITLQNFSLLTGRLKQLGFKYYNPRYLNQDPLENFFGKIRQRGQRFVNPTTSTFGQHYKSLLVNNLISRQSVGGNCEEDNCSVLLQLKKFLKQNTEPRVTEEPNVETASFESIPDAFNPLKPLEEYAIAYVGGYITKMKVKIAKCVACRCNILRRNNEEHITLYSLISAREYGGKRTQRLQYCNAEFLRNLVKMYNITLYMLKLNPYKPEILATICSVVKNNVNFNFIECEHSKKLLKEIITTFCKLLTHNFFNGVNNVLCGKDNRNLPLNCSSLLKQARAMCTKYKSR